MCGCASNLGSAETVDRTPEPLFKVGEKVYIVESVEPVELLKPYWDEDAVAGTGWVYPLKGSDFEASEKALSFSPWPKPNHVRPIAYPVFARGTAVPELVVLFTGLTTGIALSGAAGIGVPDGGWLPVTAPEWEIIDNPF